MTTGKLNDMQRGKDRSKTVRDFILYNVGDHPGNITSLTAEKFGFSHQAAYKHVKTLVDAGQLTACGTTRDRLYSLKSVVTAKAEFPITPKLEEDVVWRREVSRKLSESIPENIRNICHFGFTEMLNNVIDHSEGKKAEVDVIRTPVSIRLYVKDDGVGIFRKIQTSLNLEDERHAILELSKGKLTTDPQHHTGEGIFFTSRAFDRFRIVSGHLYFSHSTESGDWLLTRDEEKEVGGTTVIMEIDLNSKRQLRHVFDSFAPPDDFGFSKTVVPVMLAQYGEDNLVSRSQAKRLLARFDRFKEVILDFKGVNSIGQAFADEVFRVFPDQHPAIRLIPINMNKQVRNRWLAVTGDGRPHGELSH